jgi:hypothetical protein
MFRVETKRNIDSEIIKESNLSYAELISESLESIGFIDIRRQGNSISFKHYFKDTNLESFQRRYGNGALNFTIDGNKHTISIITENTIYLILSILGNLFVFIAANFHFIFRAKESLQFILIFNAVLFSFNAYGIWTTKRKYRNKHNGLLDKIEEKISNFSSTK